MMNVKFNENDAKDVARRLKVDYSTVTGWCRRGLINFIDVSSNKSNSARYQIPEEEVVYLEKLFKQWGVRKGILHYDKTRLNKEIDTVVEPVEKPYSAVQETVEEPSGEYTIEDPHDEVLRFDTSLSSDELTSIKFDAERIANTILHIKEIKERLENLEAERNQLMNEYNQLKQEMKDVIDNL
jgi:hypothetical protein